MSLLKEFNVRQLQAYAALCLLRFCKNFEIKDAAINELFHHLIQILSVNNLSSWEQYGANILITGRGDPIPERITQIINPDILKSFILLVEYCVEVGIVDMYGGATNQPMQFVEKCIAILRDYDLDEPSMKVLEEYKRGDDHWGNAISNAELEMILIAYGVDRPAI